MAPERIRVIRNGVDVGRFRPVDRMTVRRELGIEAEAPVVGMVAMFKRHKNYQDFFRLAQGILSSFPRARFVCVGDALPNGDEDSRDYLREMRGLADEMKLGSRCLFLGARNDMPEVYSMCDVTVLTSSIEGTPNVLLESMACGVPVVATDASDNRHVIPQGRAGFLVPVGDTSEMIARVSDLLADSVMRRAFGDFARERVTVEFSTEALARQTERAYLDILRHKSNLQS
jgi:glycosyltransferase involved in cell wall biosynthesis